jgi:hypothetical protein
VVALVSPKITRRARVGLALCLAVVVLVVAVPRGLAQYRARPCWVLSADGEPEEYRADPPFLC